ncbi:hypothetical protein Nepgr_033753 [Nepenthes gracilis]|uniref:Uncharacterized protein n=1 Tax=Nepenthes gracilis TaxID=150966 RepID=A0AAD3TML8_NEPGR|nr:hypothetical protein Nepgr_033753 [Nepenthes gracilis]
MLRAPYKGALSHMYIIKASASILQKISITQQHTTPLRCKENSGGCTLQLGHPPSMQSRHQDGYFQSAPKIGKTMPKLINAKSSTKHCYSSDQRRNIIDISSHQEQREQSQDTTVTVA